MKQRARHMIIGDMLEPVTRRARRFTTTDAPVLITGESGVGKELFARLVHEESERYDSPFNAVNCAAVTSSLFESQLFGHERGAFTGADRLHQGFFESTRGGTLLLDEVGELSPEVQAKLLRVLQTRTITRVGGTKSIDVDVRIVAATNRDLDAAVKAGEFREDLLYRLKVLVLHIPPLRERRDDIVPLAKALLERHGPGHVEPGLSDAALQAIRRHHWPGNVRELENALIRGIVLSVGGPIRPEHLELDASAFPRTRAGSALRADVDELRALLLGRAKTFDEFGLELDLVLQRAHTNEHEQLRYCSQLYNAASGTDKACQALQKMLAAAAAHRAARPYLDDPPGAQKLVSDLLHYGFKADNPDALRQQLQRVFKEHPLPGTPAAPAPTDAQEIASWTERARSYRDEGRRAEIPRLRAQVYITLEALEPPLRFELHDVFSECLRKLGPGVTEDAVEETRWALATAPPEKRRELRHGLGLALLEHGTELGPNHPDGMLQCMEEARAIFEDELRRQPALETDQEWAGLKGRYFRMQAELATEPVERRRLYLEAHRAYLRAWKTNAPLYPGENAVAMGDLAGLSGAEFAQLRQDVLKCCRDETEGTGGVDVSAWAWFSLGSMLVRAGGPSSADEAIEAYTRARAASPPPSRRALASARAGLERALRFTQIPEVEHARVREALS